MGKSIRDVMTTNPTAIAPSTPIVDAARSMKSENVGSLPIVEGDRLTGMLTDRDIVVRGLAEGKDAQSATAGEIASRDVVSIDPSQSLEEALRLMGEHQIRRLPVTEEDGRLVGIVAQADIALQGQDARTGKVVEEISR
jgi:CBS domain-containing protein